jgi:hypothetical protein
MARMNTAKLSVAALVAVCCTPLFAAAPGPVPKVEGVYFSGMWEDPEPPEVLRPAGAPPRKVQSMGTPPLKEPYATQVRQRQQEQAAATARGETRANGCRPGGFPGMMMPVFPIEVIQSPGQVTIVAEAFEQARRIYLNEKQIPIEDAEPLFRGHSVGHWEGNVLIVNTIGLKESVRVGGAPHSPNMRVDERITVTSKDTWEDQITITDPEYLTKPWTFTIKYNRKNDYKINEFVCEDDRIEQDPETGKARLRLGD